MKQCCMRGIAILYKHGTLRRSSYNIVRTANNAVKQLNNGSQCLITSRKFSTNRDDDDFDIPPLDLTKPSTSIPLPPNIIQQQQLQEKKKIINARGNLSTFSLSSSSSPPPPQSSELLSETTFNIDHSIPKPITEELQHSIFNSSTISTKYDIDKKLQQQQQLEEHNGEGKLTSTQRGKIRNKMRDRLSYDHRDKLATTLTDINEVGTNDNKLSYDQRDKLATTLNDMNQVGTNITEERKEQLLLLKQEFHQELMKRFPCESSSIPSPMLTSGNRLTAQSKLNNQIEEITSEILKSNIDTVSFDRGDNAFEKCSNPLTKALFYKMKNLYQLEQFGVTPGQYRRMEAKATKLGLVGFSAERRMYFQRQFELKRQAWITEDEDNAPSKSNHSDDHVPKDLTERKEQLFLLKQEFHQELMKRYPCESSSIPSPKITTGNRLKAQSKLNNEIEEISSEILKSNIDTVSFNRIVNNPFENPLDDCSNPLTSLCKKLYFKVQDLCLLEQFGVTPNLRKKIGAKATKLGLEDCSTERNSYILRQFELKRQEWIKEEEINAPSKSSNNGDINQMNEQIESNIDADHHIIEHDGIKKLQQQLEFNGGKLSSKQRGKIRQKMRDWLLDKQRSEVATSMNQLPNDDFVADGQVSLEEGLLYDHVPEDHTERKEQLLLLKQQYQNEIKKKHHSSSLTPSPKITSGKRLKIQQKLNKEIEETMKEMLETGSIDTTSFDSHNLSDRDHDRFKARLYRKLKELNNLEEFGVTHSRRSRIMERATKLGLEKHSAERSSYIQQQLELERQAWINETKKINVPPSKSTVQQPLEVLEPSPSLLQQIDNGGGIESDLRPTNTLLEDDNNDDEGSAYVIKNVASAPISSLFESNNVNKHPSYTRRSQQYNWRSSKHIKNKKRFTNVGDINNDLLWHMTNKPSRVGNSSSSHDMTKAKNENDDVLNVNNSQEKESDGNSMLSEIFPIKSAVTAVTSIFQRVTTAIGFTSTFDSNNSNNIEAKNDKQVVEESKDSSARKIRQYQCPDCNYQVTRWVVLRSKMRNCAHCSTTTASILDSDNKGSAARNFEVHFDNDNDTKANIPLPGYRKKKQPRVDRRERNGFLLPPIYRMRNDFNKTVSSIQKRIDDETKRISMNSEKKRSKTSIGKKEKSSPDLK